MTMALNDVQGRSTRKGGGDFLLGLAAATVIAGTAGALFGAVVAKPEDRVTQPAGEVKAPEKPAAALDRDKRLLALAPLLGSLASPPKTMVRIEALLLIDEDTPHQSALAASIGDDIIAYLRTVGADEIEGPSGYQFLKEELVARARTRGNGKVRDIFFTAFSVE